jgi:O-methyltransferase
VKSVFGKILRRLRQWTGPHGVQPLNGGLQPLAVPPPPQPWTYAEDGLSTTHIADFLHDPAFQTAYAAGKATGSWGTGDLRWRVYTVLWAARQAWRLPGDFVECGVHRGGHAQAIGCYLPWTTQPKRRFYLLDTFSGFPPEHRDLAAWVHRHDYRDDCWEEVRRRFADAAHVHLIRGPVPQTLQQVGASEVAFLSIDMNCAEPEVAALEYFWPKLVPGAVVVLDDYAFAEPYRRQKDAMDQWSARVGIPILTLPTGQGLVFKS